MGNTKASEESRLNREAYLADLMFTRSSRITADKLGFPMNRIKQWRFQQPGFKTAEAEILGLKPNLRQVALAEGFPKDDFLRFRELCMAYYAQREHKVVRAVNNWYQRDAYKQLQGNNRLIVILPPAHVKTSMFAIEYPTWKIMGDRNFRAVAVSKNQKEARKVVASVQERLADADFYEVMKMRLRDQGDDEIVNPLDVWFRGVPFKAGKRGQGEKWGADSFRVLGRTSGEKDDSMEAKGVGGQIQGVRADLIVLDDVQDPDSAVKSVQNSEDMLQWFNNVILGRVFDHQQVVVLANYFSPDDFAHKLLASHPEFSVVEYPALIDSTVNPDIPEGELAPLCPELWTVPALMSKKQEVGEQTWYYTWMQEAGNYDDATFKREVLQEARSSEYRVGEVPYPVTDIFMGVDPAVAASGFCAMVVWGLDKRTKQRYLIDVFNEKGMRNWDTVVAQILEYCRAYPIRTCIIELANTQGSLAFNPTLEREVRALGTVIKTYKTMTGTGGRAEQGNFDISTIGGLFDAGLITLPYSGTFTEQKRIDEYIDQLCSWRTDSEGKSIKHLTRDMTMATLFAESEAFVVANRTTPPPTQNTNRVPKWAGRAWHRTLVGS